MLRRLAVGIVASVALLGLSVSAVVAHSSPGAGSGWKPILMLRPGQTIARLTLPMTPADCGAALAAHPQFTAAGCVTQVSIHEFTPSNSQTRDRYVLASCGPIAYEGSMWNWTWWSDITVYFCWSSSYVSVTKVDCYSNNGVYPGYSLDVTWCGVGATGRSANGGDNVLIKGWVGNTVVGSYYAGQRGNLDIYGNFWWNCWNAHC